MPTLKFSKITTVPARLPPQFSNALLPFLLQASRQFVMASSLQNPPANLQLLSRLPPLLLNRRHLRSFRLSWRCPHSFSVKVSLLTVSGASSLRDERSSFRCLSMANTEVQPVEFEEEVERPPFDINLAVVLAGFSFEAYTSPPVICSHL